MELQQLEILKSDSIFEVYSTSVSKIKKISNLDYDEMVKILKERFRISKSLVEKMYVFLFDDNNEPIGVSLLSIGTNKITLLDYRYFISLLILTNTSSFVLFHNHPHNVLEASKDDINLSIELDNYVKKINVEMLDHIIITEDSWLSIESLL